MINFIEPESNIYHGVLRTFIKPIVEHLDCERYIISDKCIDGLNIHFFNEAAYLNRLGFKSRNVFMSHGIADKNWRNISSMQPFDHIMVSGPAWYTKLVDQGVKESRLFIGGYPKLDNLYGLKNPKHNTILWAPTHNFGSLVYNLSSYPRFKYYIDNLKKFYTVIISEHPANRLNKRSTESELLESRLVIADSGSTLYEAWALDIPVIFPDWIVRKDILKIYKGSFEAQIYNQGIGYHVERVNDLKRMIDQAIFRGLDNKTRCFIEGILPRALRGCSGKLVAETLLRLDTSEVT